MSGYHIALDLPEDWNELDIEPDTSAASIAAYCADLMPGAELDGWRREMEARLRLVAAQSQSIDAVSVDFFADVIDEEPWILTAALVITTIPTGADVVGVPDLERELGARGGEVSTVDLPVGPAVLSRGVHREQVPEADEPIEILHIRYFVPVADQHEITVLGFSTPTVTLDAEFSALFAAIAESLVLTPVEPDEQG